MGCDIHMAAEVWDGKWRMVEGTPPWGGRHYGLFAVLANVRNDSMFDDPIPVIAEPRGIPLDADPETISFMESRGSDGHHHSHLTLKELKDFDWGQTFTCRAMLNEEAYRWHRDTGVPVGVLKETYTSRVPFRPEAYDALMRDEADWIKTEGLTGPEFLQKYREKLGVESLVLGVEYEESVASCTPEKFLTETIPYLESLGEPEDVRICFFFDN